MRDVRSVTVGPAVSITEAVAVLDRAIAALTADVSTAPA